MKKTKLLPIIGVPALMATLIPTVVSCNPTPVDPTDEEEIIMPDIASDTKYKYEEEYGAYSYVLIRGCQWINPQHEYDDLFAEATLDGDISLITEIIPKNDNTFDVKVILDEEKNCYVSGTTLNFDLSIDVYNEETGEWEQLSDTKQYSITLNEHIEVTDVFYEPAKEAYEPITGFQIYILNGGNQITSEELDKDDITFVEDLPEDMAIDENSILGEVETNEYYCLLTINFQFQNPVTNYEGLDLNATIKLECQEGKELELKEQLKAFSKPIIDGSWSEITKPTKIIKSKDNIYEGDANAGTFEWINPKKDTQTAGDLSWEFKQEKLDELGIVSVEVTPTTKTEKSVHFKFTTNDAVVGKEFSLEITVLYKDLTREIKSNIADYSFPFILAE